MLGVRNEESSFNKCVEGGIESARAMSCQSRCLRGETRVRRNVLSPVLCHMWRNICATLKHKLGMLAPYFAQTGDSATCRLCRTCTSAGYPFSRHLHLERQRRAVKVKYACSFERLSLIILFLFLPLQCRKLPLSSSSTD